MQFWEKNTTIKKDNNQNNDSFYIVKIQEMRRGKLIIWTTIIMPNSGECLLFSK